MSNGSSFLQNTPCDTYFQRYIIPQIYFQTTLIYLFYIVKQHKCSTQQYFFKKIHLLKNFLHTKQIQTYTYFYENDLTTSLIFIIIIMYLAINKPPIGDGSGRNPTGRTRSPFIAQRKWKIYSNITYFIHTASKTPFQNEEVLSLLC